MALIRQRGVNLALLFLLLAGLPAAGAGGWESLLVQRAAAQDEKPVTVTVDNFIRAETDTYFKKRADLGRLGQFGHLRVPAPIGRQRVIRMNRDTLYSGAVFDLTAPATITLPDAGTRYRSLQVLNEDHFTKLVAYQAGRYTLTRQAVGTRYAYAIVRTFFDPADPKDLEAAHRTQDGIRVEQASTGVFQIPRWDAQSLARVHNAVLALAALSASGGMSGDGFGDTGQVKPVAHLLATAAGWGGLPRADATYSNVTPEQNDGTVAYTLDLDKVPVDGFWSISVYNEKGFFEKNDRGVYSINSASAAKNADGSVTVHFGGDPEQANYLPIVKGWNYTVRLYQPRKEVLESAWKLPAPRPVIKPPQ
jgi:hypothetical protein